MSTVTVFGFSIIILAVAIFFACFAKSPSHPKYILVFTIALLASGLVCVFNTPVSEISFGKFGSIKTSVERASSSANAAEGKLREIDATVDFSMTLAAALAEDRRAFDKLERLSNDRQNRFSERAKQAWESTRDTHASMLDYLYEVPWRGSGDPGKLSIADIEKIFEEQPVTTNRIAVIQYLQKRPNIPKREKIEMYLRQMKREPNLTVLENIGRAFNELTGCNIKPLAVKAILEWWSENKSQLE